MALRTITYDPDLHKTPSEWVKYFEEIRGRRYAQRNPTFAAWLQRGVPSDFGGGEMEVYLDDLPGGVTLYKWVKEGG